MGLATAVLPIRLCSGLLLLLACASLGAQTTVAWREGFEATDFWERWHSEGSGWQVLAPITGPGQAFAGAQCAGAPLSWDYPAQIDTRLIRNWVFIVPPAAQHPRLRFWQWFQDSAGSSRRVEIKVGTGGWEAMTPVSGWNGVNWSHVSFDLSAYSDRVVQIAFHYRSDSSSQPAGSWYVDELTLETSLSPTELINSTESFESGVGDWFLEGAWHLEVPAAGPLRAFSGTNCLAAVLKNQAAAASDDRAISPDFLVPDASQNPRLRFWHWFDFGAAGWGQVEIRTGGGAWQSLTVPLHFTGLVWSRPLLDLRPFAGQSVQISFHLRSELTSSVPAAGWYVDDVIVETGGTNWNSIGQVAGFETGSGDWAVEAGTWEIGAPSFGPRQASSGRNCAGTVLSGPYAAGADSRLISPEFAVPSADVNPQLQFAEWFELGAGAGASLEIRTPGSPWQSLMPSYSGTNVQWRTTSCDLSAYSDQTVQIAFRFRSETNAVPAAGWYIDQVNVQGNFTAPQLQVARFPNGSFGLSLTGGTPGTVYSLEVTSELKADPDASRWTRLETGWSGSQRVYSSDGLAQFYRITSD